jgi:hypothetical protein
VNALEWRRKLDELAREYGATVERTKNNHYRIIHPSGWRVVVASTPGDWRSFQNARRDIRRAAVAAPRHRAA